MMKEIKIKDLCKTFKGNTILNNINLEVSKGEICGIKGRNGSGKTVLFKLICGLLTPSSGLIEISGKKIEKGQFPEDIGVIIENPGFITTYSGLSNLKFLASINNKINERDIVDAITKVGLDPNNKKSVKNYSLGMRQRLGIAQAIMEKPKVLILDEPMNALDKDGVESMRNLFLDLKNKGTTILFTSHNAEDIESLSDRIFEMNNGELTLIK